MATLSLNGDFTYPVELKQTLTVDGVAEFNNAVSQGFDNGDVAQYAIAAGHQCAADALYSFAAGMSSYADALYSRADGFHCSSYGDYSRAYGYRAKTKDGDGYSFVWQGVSDANEYVSKGSGTFSINPVGRLGDGSSMPVCGFFIGESCITDYISSHAADRILKNPNVGEGGFGQGGFVAPQEFSSNVYLTGPVSAYSTFRCVNGSVLNIDGTAYINTNNDIDSDDVILQPYVASTQYARGVALSAITKVGQYFPIDRIEDIDFDGKRDFAASVDLLRTLVTSSVNNPSVFYGSDTHDGDLHTGGRSAATRDYAFALATSAAVDILPKENFFTGDTNTFNNIRVSDGKRLTLGTATTADFLLSKVLVEDGHSILSVQRNTPATEAYVRSYATSAVDRILSYGNTYGRTSNDLNTYVAKSEFRGQAAFSSEIRLNNGAIADFTNGKLYIRNPSATSSQINEPATTMFVRNTALSAINTLLGIGGWFGSKSRVGFNGPTEFNSTNTVNGDSTVNGKTTFSNLVTFNGKTKFNTSVDFFSPKGVEAYVKTQSITNSDGSLAASTGYVKNYTTDYVARTLSTSSISVKNLMTMGDPNDFQNDNIFLKKNIYVSTMEPECDDTHAASCEFVKNIVGGINMFDLFDMKFMDYRLPTTSKWKMSGNWVTKMQSPNAYAHIYDDYIHGTSATETISGILITYTLGSDGHKIVAASNISALNNLYNATGIAWYYVIDTTAGRERIMLPRSKYGFDISTSDVGGYIPASLPAHDHFINLNYSAHAGGSGYPHHGSDSACPHSSGNLPTGPARWKSPIGTGTTVQPPATKVFLYFYCG